MANKNEWECQECGHIWLEDSTNVDSPLMCPECGSLVVETFDL
jgi:rubrerythrin